jgi:putative oxidoreductase
MAAWRGSRRPAPPRSAIPVEDPALLDKLAAWLVARPARAARFLRDPFIFALRLYVGWQFFKAGWIKIHSWSSTMYLFQYEYHVPWLSPGTAAVAGTFGELFFPALLFVGLATRLAALGLSVVNVVAVISYADVIFSEGFEGAAADHYLWGLIMLTIMIYGPGKLSVDELLLRSGRTSTEWNPS